MQLISYSIEDFKVASDGTEGIPDHAVEIKGELIKINKRNLQKWGINSDAVDGIIASGVGLPVRMCNDINPHACDFAHNHFADIGYTTKMWRDGDWIKAAAAITDKTARQKLDDGTWMPMKRGKWSVAGYPGSEMDTEGMFSRYVPAAISFVLPPYKPAFEGSKFELVVAAVNEFKEQLQLENIKQDTKEEIMTEEKDVTDPVDPKPDGQEGTKDVKDTKTEPMADHKTVPKVDDKPAVEPKTEPTTEKEEVTMYSQDDFDKKLTESLETQKLQYEEQMANMTPTENLESMLSAAKKETMEATFDQIKREELSGEYKDLLTDSTVLMAPFVTDGKPDDAKLNAHMEETQMLSAAILETKIEHAKAMVAAMPAGTAFDNAKIKSEVIEIGINSNFTVGDCKGGDK